MIVPSTPSIGHSEIQSVAPADDGIEFSNSTNVGQRLRQVRESRRITLKEVAARVGISEGFLSQIERGKSTPSLKTLYRVAAVYGMSPGDLLTDHWTRVPAVIRASLRPVLELGELTKTRMIPHSADSLEVLGGVLARGGSAGEPYAHGDSEELLVVLKGSVRAEVAGESFDLSAGDTLYYRSSMLHTTYNTGSDESEVIWVISPPS